MVLIQNPFHEAILYSLLNFSTEIDYINPAFPAKASFNTLFNTLTSYAKDTLCETGSSGFPFRIFCRSKKENTARLSFFSCTYFS